MPSLHPFLSSTYFTLNKKKKFGEPISLLTLCLPKTIFFRLKGRLTVHTTRPQGYWKITEMSEPLAMYQILKNRASVATTTTISAHTDARRSRPHPRVKGMRWATTCTRRCAPAMAGSRAGQSCAITCMQVACRPSLWEEEGSLATVNLSVLFAH